MPQAIGCWQLSAYDSGIQSRPGREKVEWTIDEDLLFRNPRGADAEWILPLEVKALCKSVTDAPPKLMEHGSTIGASPSASLVPCLYPTHFGLTKALWNSYSKYMQRDQDEII